MPRTQRLIWLNYTVRRSNQGCSDAPVNGGSISNGWNRTLCQKLMSCDGLLEMQLFVWGGGVECASRAMETWHVGTGVCGLLTNYSVEPIVELSVGT